jgi:hypothetical protein
MTTAEEALQAGKAATEADRPLSLQEFAAIRVAINDPSTDPITRGGLQALGNLLERQSSERLRRQQAAVTEATGREHQRLLDEREQKWRDLDTTVAALLNAIAETRDPSLMALAKHLQQPDRGPPPASFMGELLPEYQRLPGLGF